MKGRDRDSIIDGEPGPGGRRSGLARVLRAAAIVVVLAVAVLVGGFGWFVAEIGTMDAPPEPAEADAIVVLTGGTSRIEAAIDLLRSGKGKRLLISGVNPVADENDLQRATGGERALFDCCVDIDHAALNTIGNAQESAKWVARNAFASVIVVTNNYHVPRSLLEMRRSLRNADLRAYPVVHTPLDDGRWMVNPRALRVVATEYFKLVAAIARGLLPEASPDDDGDTTMTRATRNDR